MMQIMKLSFCLILFILCLSVTFGGCGDGPDLSQEDYQEAYERDIERMLRDDKERRHNEAWGDLAPSMHKTWE